MSDAPPRPAARFPLPLDAVAKAPAQARGAPRATPPSASRAPSAPTVPARASDASIERRPAAAAASASGQDFSGVRERMLQRLRAQGQVPEAVLAAFAAVPRHAFVDAALAGQAYEDTALPIGLAQTISKPSVVARMLGLLCGGTNVDQRMQSGQALPMGRVLEIGSGCGYQAALLARLARTVVSVERLRALHDKARENLNRIDSPAVRLVFGDGRLGHAPNAPFDAIVAAAGGEDLPSAWLEQLAVGGRLVAPMHDSSAGGQVLLVVDRTASGYRRQQYEGVHFVPLKFGTL